MAIHNKSIRDKGFLNSVSSVATFTPASNATDWYRICTLSGNNQPNKVRFILSNDAHFSAELELSRGAGGDNCRLAFKLLGFYSYWNWYPMDYRLVTDGTNASTHCDIRFSANTSNSAMNLMRINVLEGFAQVLDYPTYPCTNIGSSNSTTSSNWPIRIGTNSTFTYREFIIVPGNYSRTSVYLVNTNGAITSGTIVT